MPGGRPTKYKSEYAEQARRLCENNAFTDVELASFFEVTLSTLSLWKVKHQEFSDALKLGKAPANERVVRSLYDRAMGYSCVETDIRVIEGEIVMTDVVKHYPPDPTSMIFFLKNRAPDEWRDKQDIKLDVTDNLADALAKARRRVTNGGDAEG